MPENEYSVKITTQAAYDLDGIYSYIANVFYAKDIAENTIVKIESGINQLTDQPYSAPLMSEPAYNKLGIHKLTVAPYNVFYLINTEKKQIEIIHVLHGLQNYHKKLNNN